MTELDCWALGVGVLGLAVWGYLLATLPKERRKKLPGAAPTLSARAPGTTFEPGGWLQIGPRP